MQLNDPNQPNRLDRIEALLERSILESSRRNAASDERMTRLEQQQEQFWAESKERLAQAEQIALSNARSIQALGDELTSFRLTTEQNIEQARIERQELRGAMVRLEGVAEGMANWLENLDTTQPTILGRLRQIENKIDRLLERDEEP